jgi:hypothetical protein
MMNNYSRQNGGLAALASRMQTLGRDGDSILAHINPDEARQLMQMGGRGTINPATGLPEFATRDTFDPALYAAKYPGVVEVFGNNEEDMFRHYESRGQAEGRVGNAAEVAARESGYAGVFGVDPDTGETYDPSGGYRQFKLDDDQIQDIPGRSYGLYEDRVPGSYITAHGGRVIQSPARNTALHEGLIDQFGYGGDFGTGGFNAFTRVQNADTRDAIANYIEDFRNNYGPTTIARSVGGSTPTLGAPFMPEPRPRPGGVDVPGGMEPVGVSYSPYTSGDVMTPVDYNRPATPYDEAMLYQGVGVKYYIYEMGQDGNLVKRYVPASVPGAQREYTGTYGAYGGEHDFYPGEDYSVTPELDVKGILGL